MPALLPAEVGSEMEVGGVFLDLVCVGGDLRQEGILSMLSLSGSVLMRTLAKLNASECPFVVVWDTTEVPLRIG